MCKVSAILVQVEGGLRSSGVEKATSKFPHSMCHSVELMVELLDPVRRGLLPVVGEQEVFVLRMDPLFGEESLRE